MTDHDLPVTDLVRHRPRLLLVDDDERTARLLARMLCEEGFDTEVAISGVAAIDRLARQPTFDLLITDFHVSGADGLVIAGHARVARSGIPVFVVTGDPHAVGVIEQPVEVITKPVDFRVLVRHLHAVVASPGQRFEMNAQRELER